MECFVFASIHKVQGILRSLLPNASLLAPETQQNTVGEMVWSSYTLVSRQRQAQQVRRRALFMQRLPQRSVQPRLLQRQQVLQ